MTTFFAWAGDSEYFLSWLVYLAGVAGCLLVAWRMSSSWPVWLGRAFRLFAAALLLPPAIVSEGKYFLAPAFIVAPFEWFSYGPERAEPAISALVIAFAAAVLVYVLTPLLGWIFGKITTKA
jgi:hypothetical protein